jgi:hypothetical protein
LLFVAVSVNPGGIGERGTPAKRVQATSALAAFLSPLFISLVALLPASSIGATAIALGSTGAFTMLSLLLITLRRHRDVSTWSRINMIVLIAGQFAAYVIQIVLGAELLSNPRAGGPFGPLTSLMIVFFAFGVTRTWEYVDGLPMGRWGTISQATRSSRRTLHLLLRPNHRKNPIANSTSSDLAGASPFTPDARRRMCCRGWVRFPADRDVICPGLSGQRICG